MKPGPLFSRLQKGFAVQTSSGQTVQSTDVMGPTRICPAVMLIACPHRDYIESLCTNPFWATCKGDKQPAAIMHSCSTSVLADDRYIQFMASFGSQVKHLYTTSDTIHDSITHKKFAKYTEELQNVSDEIYQRPAVSDVSIRVNSSRMLSIILRLRQTS